MKNVYLCILTNQRKMNSFNVYITSFGAPYADATASKGADVQPYKYNGKELDLMHGLNTYDYGARQHDPILARWDRIDPLCEKFYSTSPYAYCANNPIMMIDPDGCKPDSLEAALMSGMAYRDKNYNYYSGLLKNTGWKQVHKSDSRTGFKTALFKRVNKKSGAVEYCLAFAGTDDGKLKDVVTDGITDVLNFLQIPTFQHAQAIGAGLGMSSVGDDEITFTGHSLGGGLADAASRATGNDAIIFNAASVGLFTKGIASLFGIGKKSGYVKHYRSISDPVNSLQDHILNPASGYLELVNTGKPSSHAIKDIVNAFINKK